MTLCSAGFICSVAFCQPNGASTTAPETKTPVDEEVIVIGHTPGEIRTQIRQAEEAVYDRFNEINSDDEFDIHCRSEVLTGSRIRRRVCEANFWRDAQAQAASETVHALRGESATPATVFLGKALYKRQLLTEEMKRLGAEDQDLQKDLVRLATLEQALDRRSERRRSSATASTQRTADDGALPYDAAVASDVRMGRKPWRHALMHPTFTFAHVYGEIGGIDVTCARQQTEQLQYEEGVEWTLPDDWEACDLRVDAPRGTTFSLYEFE